MRLSIIGCAGSFPGPDSPASCYLLEAPFEGRTFRLVVDLGSGALGGLQRAIELSDIDAVALSHLHADHCLDMCGLYVARKYHPDGVMGRVPVFGPTETSAFLARAYGLEGDPGMTNEFDFVSWTPSVPMQIGPFGVTAMQVDHPVEAYAIKIVHDAKTLVYSGDTGPTEIVAEFVQGADVFLSEASYVESGNNPPNLHLTGANAGDYATRGRVGRLLLTHIPAWTDRTEVLNDAKGAFDGPTELVSAGSTYDI